MSARFEIVRTDAEQPWHARFRAANGRIVWTTENYSRRDDAIRSLTIITNQSLSRGSDSLLTAWLYNSPAEVRFVDLRTQTPDGGSGGEALPSSGQTTSTTSS